MDRESPEKKKTRLYAEAVAAIGDDEITKLSEKARGALETVLKLHIGAEVDNEMKAESERDRATKAAIDKEKFELITYCNLYRRQVDRFEALISKAEFHHLFPSFVEVVQLTIPIFNKERKVKKLSLLNLDAQKLDPFFHTSLTRIEKWRTILVWFMMDQIKITTSIENDDIFESLKRIMEHTVETQLKTDFDNLKTSTRHKAIYLLKERFLSSFTLAFKDDFRKLFDFEINGIAKGFNEAYQRCSKEIKRFENLSATPEEYVVIRKSVTGSAQETEDDFTINICLDLIITLGKELATS